MVIDEICKFFKVSPERMPIVAGNRGTVSGLFEIIFNDNKSKIYS
jgi:hypothetical protein